MGGYLNDAKSLIEIEADMQKAHTSLPHGGYNAGAHLTCQIIIIYRGIEVDGKKKEGKREIADFHDLTHYRGYHCESVG